MQTELNLTITFWHQLIGQHLTNASPEDSVQPLVPTRLKKGVGPNRVGAMIDAHYIACGAEGGSFLIGKLELGDVQGLRFVARENTSGQRFIAHWLVHDAPLNEPWMIGVIGTPSAIQSLSISQPPALCRFGEANGGFDFNLAVVREAHAKMSHLPWKKVVAPAIHAYQAFRLADAGSAELAKAKMNKILAATPELRKILPSLQVLPRSGEYEILSWYNRER
jgi:hypothetical protein